MATHEAGQGGGEGPTGDVLRNELSGGQVSGGVVQARDIAHLTIGAGAPPPPPPVRVPRQVPAPPRGFVNRTEELAALDALLAGEPDAPPVAVISGIGGVGKSAFTRRWAHQVSDRFGDGQLYADLGALRHRGGTEVSDVLGGFLRALGVHEEWIPAELPERASMFRSKTAGLRLLLLIDDAEHAAEVTPLLPASRASAVVVTSHRRLGELLLSGAVPIRMAPLSADEGARLLAGMLGEDRLRADPAAAAELVRLCGGLPIALRVAGARLVQRPAWTIERVVRELTDAARRLDRLAVEGKPVVESVFEAAYDGLPPGAARLYRRLGLLPGPDFPPGAATAIDGGDDDVTDLLDVLLDANLLDELGDGDRYRFHDLVRLHAARCAEREESAEERDAALERAAEWYLGRMAAADLAVMGRRLRLADHGRRLAEGAAFGSPGEALDWLDAERANILALLRGAAARGWDAFVWQAAEAMWALYYQRKHYADWLEANRLGVAAALRCGDLAAQARMRNQVARALLELGEYGGAHEELVLARAAAEESGNRRMEAAVLESLGRVDLERGDLEAATAAFREALRVNEDIGNPRGVGLQTYHLGLAHSRGGRHDEAAAAFERAMTVMTEVGDELLQGKIGIRLGTAYRSLGRSADAVRVAGRAAEIMRARRVPAQEARAWELLAALAAESGDPGTARAHVRQAVAAWLAAGNTDRATELRAEHDL
ncbi:tetratricopeptide repeat protein [Spongiactinospora rosea]|uniref:tetratricopeptide repeat protein n=1 Tax=Spongiactinospora rosea TaxID=2248750 RepID=UPI001313E226|nr:tetratricopeptide repeat protein [Spongiactinospora rosea]